MPISTFLIWPALHAMYGLKEHRSNKIPQSRKYAGRGILILSALLMAEPIGLEHGFFFWLFALMAAAMVFVQLRVWQPIAVPAVTALSLVGFIYQGANYVL